MSARLPHSIFDQFGRCLTVAGAGETISVQVEGVRDRQRVQSFELDAEMAVDVAHDLLEWALSRADCDEITDAVAALRALAEREDALRVQGETTNGDGQ